MTHAAVEGERPTPPARVLESGRSRLVKRVAEACRWLWLAVGLVEIALLTRILVMLAVGVTGDEGGNSAAVSLLYHVTGVLSDRFDVAVAFQIPLSGLPHAFDIAALLAMDSLFFAALATTKIAGWYAERLSQGQEPVSTTVRLALARARRSSGTDLRA